MSKDSCPKYYQKNKERLQEKVLERYQNLSKEGKLKRDNMVKKNKKISLKLKSKGWLSTQTYITN